MAVQGIIEMNLFQFSLVYLLLVVVLVIMKKARIKQTHLLLLASFRMTVQLTLAGLLLTYILKKPHPVFTMLYLLCMVLFAIHRILKKNKELNPKFKLIIGGSLACSGLLIVLFFVIVVVGADAFNPQYVIPLSGMIFGNAMTGVNLGIDSFYRQLNSQQARIEALLNIGAAPRIILLPFVNQALETALIPTMNSMLGMGIVSLPGMMTGQILSGTLPMTAILYQIAIMIAICAVVCLSVFCSLYFGYKTLYNKRNQIRLLP